MCQCTFWKLSVFDWILHCKISDVGCAKYTWPPLQKPCGSKTSKAKPCHLPPSCLWLPGSPNPWMDFYPPSGQHSTSARQPAAPKHPCKWSGANCHWTDWSWGALLWHLLQVFLLPQIMVDSNFFRRLLKDRIICLMGPVDDYVSSIVVAQLLFLQSESAKKPIHM